ncbi:hypothetical protein IOK49_04135 [Fervidicoccus fontis]|uniref:Uncharacterized protein n=1 Tax=Fervidicoccus fontis TaxID=683846 RepID=A0A843AK00_9CREN|nr:hypothetical protein [Fervidicoccus fontis]MBE9391261.1 hypothetical protein [Fervidicoccus fontis]
MRGSANLIAGIIFIAILATLIFPLFQSFMNSSSKLTVNMNQLVGNAVSRVNKAVDLTLYSDGTLEIDNTGSLNEYLAYLIVNSTGSILFVPLSINGTSFLSQFNPTFSGGSSLSQNFALLPPGSSIVMRFPTYNYIPIAVTTLDGSIIYVHQASYSYLLNQNLNGISYLLNPVTFFTSNLEDEIKSGKISLDENLIATPTSSFVQNLSGGVYRLNSLTTKILYPLVLYQECDNATVSIMLNLTGNIINGFQPEWESNPNRNASNPVFNMLITGAIASPLDSKSGYFNVSSVGCSFNITYGNSGWTPTSSSSNFASTLANWLSGSSNPWRIKIEGLNATNIAIKYYTYNSYSNLYFYIWHNGMQSIGKYYYGGVDEQIYTSSNLPNMINVPQTTIIIQGVASSIKFYNTNTSLANKPSTYDPYLIIADTDGNGYPELIFTTEDFSFSHSVQGSGSDKPRVFTIADTYSSGDSIPPGKSAQAQYVAVDYTTVPLEMILTQVPINGTQYLGVDVVASLYFHDSIYGQNVLSTITATDRGLLSIMLLDVNNSYSVVSSKNFTYQDLASLESCYPPSTTSFSINVVLPVPYSPHLYEVAVAFWDPYIYDSETGTNNDEVTLGVEFIGFQLYSR